MIFIFTPDSVLQDSMYKKDFCDPVKLRISLAFQNFLSDLLIEKPEKKLTPPLAPGLKFQKFMFCLKLY
jgi:hypothetical protein